MHTSHTLRSHQFRIADTSGAPVSITAGLTAQDRLGVVSPRYEDAILGAGPAILAFVTAFYDLQRAEQERTGQPFQIYPDYFIFLSGEDGRVRGQAGGASLDGAVSSALGWLDVWPDDKWVITRDSADLWQQVLARQITHLLLPANSGIGPGPVPGAVFTGLKAIYRYLFPTDTDSGDALRIELGDEPLDVIVEAVRRLPPESPAHEVPLHPYGRLLAGAETQ